MKERLKKRVVRWQPDREVLSRAGRLLLYGFGGGLLAVLPVGNQPVPLAACAAAACSQWELAAVMAGSLAGYLLRWDLASDIYSIVLTVVLPLIAWGLRKSSHRDVVWFLPAAFTVAAGAVGLGFLWQLDFDPGQAGRIFLCLLIVFAGSLVCRQALLRRHFGAMALLAAALLAALSMISLGRWFNLGICAALFLTAVTSGTAEGLGVAAACGMVLELAAPLRLPYTAFFCLCSGVMYALRRRTVFHRSLALLLLSAGFAWLAAELQAQLFLLSAVGACLATLTVPRLNLPGSMAGDEIANRLHRRLQRASDVLLRLHDTVLLPHTPRQDPDTAEIFDYAADRVCCHCGSYSLCWEQEAAQTYRDLCTAAEPILARCKAAPEDFPASFAGRCQNLEQFIQVVNSQLDALLSRRQYQARLREDRELLRNQYLLLARYLQSAADTAVLTEQPGAQFEAEVAARALGRSGKTLSGDRGACFHGPGEQFYVLLCDGMGTGRGAAAESSSAIETLSGLLRAGMDPASALQLLNSAYVLRDDGCFSTVDLLQVDLHTGDSLLLKWGAAPSYLKRGNRLRSLGQAAMPPGLAVAGERSIQRMKLTLQEGDLLVLTSDGADADATARCIQEHHGGTLGDLAAGIVAAASAGDDITAVTMRLKKAVA